MDRVLHEKDHLTGFSSDYCILEKVLGWLEKEDTDVERMMGYGLCLASVTYFLARLVQAW